MTEKIKNIRKDPETCSHTATHRVSGTRGLWHCIQCGGMLKDNVELIRAEEKELAEPGRGGLVERIKKGMHRP